MGGCCEGTLVGESGDLLGYYRVLFHAGARSAHAIQRRLGDHLPEFLLPWFRPWTEQGDASLSLAAFLTAHAAPLHLPHFRPGHL